MNDIVQARWLSGDKSFYPARITSVTGSSSAPIYTVTFKSYNNVETLRGSDVRPDPTESKKRKADGSPSAVGASTTSTANPSVISAAASIDPDLASQARTRELSKVGDGPTRPAKVPRKVKANKELEAGKSKWQDFSTKGKMGKAGKRESMFRTPDGVNARGEFRKLAFRSILPAILYLSIYIYIYISPHHPNSSDFPSQSVSRARAKQCERILPEANTSTRLGRKKASSLLIQWLCWGEN